MLIAEPELLVIALCIGSAGKERGLIDTTDGLDDCELYDIVRGIEAA